MIVIKLAEAVGVYRRRTGKRITHREIADATGLSKATIDIIGSKFKYNATLETIDKICAVLDVTLDQILERLPDPPPEIVEEEDTKKKKKTKAKKKKAKKKTTRKKKKTTKKKK